MLLTFVSSFQAKKSMGQTEEERLEKEAKALELMQAEVEREGDEESLKHFYNSKLYKKMM